MVSPDEMLMDAHRISQDLYDMLPDGQYSALSMVMGALMLSRDIYEQESTENMEDFHTFLYTALECFDREDGQTIQ